MRVGLRVAHSLRRNYTQSAKFITVLGTQYPTDSYTNIPSSIISKLPLRLHTQPSHPLNTLRLLIESHFPTFASFPSLPPLVSPTQNFDDLSFPPEHPGRSRTDSYYINRDLMLRTHTSAHEVEVFARGADRWLLAADVYRRDEIDGTHYPVFHQVEGARLFDATPEGMRACEAEAEGMEGKLEEVEVGVEDVGWCSEGNPCQEGQDPLYAECVARHLKGSLNGLILRLFGGREPLRVRWIEAYFPFTGPSYEVEVFYRGEWLEILGCGVVRQATLDKANVPGKIGWAFGLGLERIAMILFQIPDIRLFWSRDARFLDQFASGEITAFKAYSKFPPCYKDVSFWTGPGEEERVHENDFCDLVRDVAGDLVENVKRIDLFTHPKTHRTSVCYRVTYRSMDRSLSHEETNQLHAQVVSRLAGQFRVEIR